MGGKSGREELELAYLFPGCPVAHECQVKEKPDKKNNFSLYLGERTLDVRSATC